MKICPHELDDSYDSYMEESEGKSFESDFDENEEVEETELEGTDESLDDLESDLDSKYDSYIEDKDLSSYEKGKATDVTQMNLILKWMTIIMNILNTVRTMIHPKMWRTD